MSPINRKLKKKKSIKDKERKTFVLITFQLISLSKSAEKLKM